jgi:predicted RNA binding protein YcfA (HicA-like mRNA interferase family)
VTGLPVISGDDLVKVLRKAGFSWDHTEGSHMILINPSGRRLSVPRHDELGRGFLRALIKDAGLSREEFLNLSEKE